MSTKTVYMPSSAEDAVKLIESQLSGAMQLRVNASWYWNPDTSHPDDSRGQHFYAGVQLGERLIVDVHADTVRELVQLALSALLNWKLANGVPLEPKQPARPRPMRRVARVATAPRSY